LLHWEENKQQHSFLVIGFQSVKALNGFGILFMQGTDLLLGFKLS
jgi:hypothetical protein